MVSKFVTPTTEKRKHPRLENNIPLKICCDDGDFVTETRNISRSGAYCLIKNYIAPMVKLKVQILLPVKKNGKKTAKKIFFNGVVVRTESSGKKNFYNVAIFFNDISPKDAQSISDHVSNYLEKN